MLIGNEQIDICLAMATESPQKLYVPPTVGLLALPLGQHDLGLDWSGRLYVLEALFGLRQQVKWSQLVTWFAEGLTVVSSLLSTADTPSRALLRFQRVSRHLWCGQMGKCHISWHPAALSVEAVKLHLPLNRVPRMHTLSATYFKDKKSGS